MVKDNDHKTLAGTTKKRKNISKDIVETRSSLDTENAKEVVIERLNEAFSPELKDGLLNFVQSLPDDVQRNSSSLMIGWLLNMKSGDLHPCIMLDGDKGKLS